MIAPNRTLAWSDALLDELVRAGVRHVVVSPGSRSAPLALSAAVHPSVVDLAVLDERSASFLALGMARAGRRAVALVCTSGTAAANYFPAVIEAHYSRVPLILLTADRPPELRDRDAGQTIDQVGLYGRYVRFSADLPAPAVDDASFRHLRSLAARAVAEASSSPAGPVHLNLPLREPLAPVEVEADAPGLRALGSLARRDAAGGVITRVEASPGLAASPAVIERIAEWVCREPRGWLVVGPLDAGADLVDALSRLSQAAGWPILAEPLSQLRCGPHPQALLVDAHDAVLRATRFKARHAPRAVLRFGSMPTSKPLRELLGEDLELHQVVIDPHGWSDPTLRAAEIVRADPLLFLRELIARLSQLRAPVRDESARSEFAARWVGAGQRARRVLQRQLSGYEAITEPGVVHALACCLPDGATLFSASSLPVRDVDAFWPAGERRVRFLANRGANGIDGTLSTALGAALACGTAFAALVGDLALLHDWTGVLSARSLDVDAVIAVVDNDGGGIFEGLPLASTISPAIFERHFATPQGVDLVDALRGFGLDCVEASSSKDLEAALHAALDRGGVRFVVARTERKANAAFRHALFESAISALDEESGSA